MLRLTNFLMLRTRSVLAVVKYSSFKMNYHETIEILNSLQSNKSALQQIRNSAQKSCTNLQDMRQFLHRIDIDEVTLNKLSVIHIAGTKGKGSTSALCESILRHHGVKTGFYSSPHLVAVRERIRLNGKIIDEELFSLYFSHVYGKLLATKSDNNNKMPNYFAFLTLLAIDVFLKENVDVAIMEVGIGGTVDFTNVVSNVPVVGITSLGLDHTSILGESIEKIAQAKAGIMKPGCIAYTVKQTNAAHVVLRNVADEVKCNLYIAPELCDYHFPNHKQIQLVVDIDACRMNTSLAIQLSHAWLRSNNNMHILHSKYDECNQDVVYHIPAQTVDGINKFTWPGRFQIMQWSHGHIFLDGAHTQESLKVCIDWFMSHSRKHCKVLVFSSTGDRNSQKLLSELTKCYFNKIYFVPPCPLKELNTNNDNYSILEQYELMKRCKHHASIWKTMTKCSHTDIIINECVLDAFDDIKANFSDCDALFTGSLHLVGAALTLIDPSLTKVPGELLNKDISIL